MCISSCVYTWKTEYNDDYMWPAVLYTHLSCSFESISIQYSFISASIEALFIRWTPITHWILDTFSMELFARRITKLFATVLYDLFTSNRRILCYSLSRVTSKYGIPGTNIESWPSSLCVITSNSTFHFTRKWLKENYYYGRRKKKKKSSTYINCKWH